MDKTITIPLTEKELQTVVGLLDYVLKDVLTSGVKAEDEEVWAFENSIVEKLKAVQSQAKA